MAELMSQTFPDNFGPACSKCLAPLVELFEKYSHFLTQNQPPEVKITNFSEAVREEILARWKEFIISKSKSLFIVNPSPL